jgi:hypothetical protein
MLFVCHQLQNSYLIFSNELCVFLFTKSVHHLPAFIIDHRLHILCEQNNIVQICAETKMETSAF